jgi:gamma-glutamyl-gamma-aminobutyrate hydrolase PuuD
MTMHHYYSATLPRKRKTTHRLDASEGRATLSATIAALLSSEDRAALPAGYRPRIGLPADLIWDQRTWPFVGAHAACVLAIEQAGGEICPFHVRTLGPQEDPFLVLWRAIRQCDGLCLSGSWGDIDPRLYGEHPHPQTELPEVWLHWWMIHLALFATVLRVPLLAICGGMQAWNVALGGRLLQDLRGRVHVRHLARRATPQRWALHPITVLPRTTLSSYLADEGGALWVPSAHNQAVDILVRERSRSYTTPGLHDSDLDLPRLQVSARSPDELVAAVEIAPPAHRGRLSSDFALGFQDHLEWSTESWATTIFRRFVEAAQDYALRRASTPAERWEALSERLGPALERVLRLLSLRQTGQARGGAYAAPFR